ncbi:MULTISPECIES: hypothetical protein [Sorangium]|uniref:Uncharacterized protein n=1 Tax=Sorangium cellulosum TaxID=56 RepID=A0A4P2QG08_SORCE|nr:MULTISPECIES: hypothetical protein [Sorangium]AUX28183.1 hypothetical protein SOCE836_002510 [Sorangium cellulosum]WCQ87583.1 hypothetical protein NQZ70_00246 [Sorangium sp. Soce836]
MGAATNIAAEAQEARAGISLAQYAAVRAAVAEGFPLADVLAVEGLAPRAFARADLAWKRRLVAEPELLATYERELAHAEDWLDRLVEPLAENAAAWAGFLAAFEAHPAPFELLQENDLGMNDVARLRRRWARRAEEDAKLGELLVELRAKPAELGPLRVGPRVLRPSRGADAGVPAKAPTDEPTATVTSSEPGLGLAEYAALCAELEALPEQRERVLRRHGLTDEETRVALERRWQAVLERDAALAKDFERLQAHHARRLEMLLARARDVANVEGSIAPLSALSAPSALPSGEAVAPDALRGTGPLLAAPRGAVVPFIPAQGEFAVETAEPKSPRGAEPLAGTAPLPDIPQRAALPFPQTSASAPAKPPPPVVAETGPLLDVPRGPALPFRAGASGPTPTAQLQRPRAPWELAETSPVQALPQGAAVPFAATAPASPAGAPASRRPAPQAPAQLGETSLRLEIPRELLRQTARGQDAVTGATSQSSTMAPSPSPSSEGWRERSSVLAEPLEIVLPLAQYAALCAELALFPDAAEKIFQRYGLGSAEKRSAVDTAWKERLHEHPTEYARWQEMYRRCHAHFAKRGTPAG